MSIRKFPVALALGLPVAVLAHMASFGDAHTLGGHAHRLLLDGTITALCAIMAALLGAAIIFASARTNGSIVASRLTALLPDPAFIFGASVVWIGLIERIESTHQMAFPVIAAALILITLAAHAALRFGIRVLARLAVSIFERAFAKRFTPRVAAGKAPLLHVSIFLNSETLFSRPPPLRL